MPDRYIVVLRDGVADPGAVAAEHRDRYGANVAFVYRSAMKGYAATIPTERLEAVRADARVRFVSDDRPVAAVSAAQIARSDTIVGGSATATERRIASIRSTVSHYGKLAMRLS